jgi:hypothetical protein
MRYAEAEVDVYAEEMAAYLDCLREEQRDAAEEEAGVRGQWEEAADAFGPAERRVRRVGAAAGRATPEPAGGACPFAATGGFRDEPSQEEP